MISFQEYRDRTYEPVDISPEQTELATSLRIPFVKTSHPRWSYVTAVIVEPVSPVAAWAGMAPTEDEVRMIASFNDAYLDHWLNDSFKAVMREFAPFDIDGGANGRYLIKFEHGGWGHRLRTWTQGPRFWPMHHKRPHSLIEVLDFIHSIGDEPMPHWVEWKATHPEIFGSVVES